MTIHERVFLDTLAAGELGTRASRRARSIGLRLVAWAQHFNDYWVAATMYEQLSRLSDVQLARRGLSRGTLAHDVCEAGGNDR
jgi:hypothetical protein